MKLFSRMEEKVEALMMKSLLKSLGIFNGKLSEQSTGLTSDLTENVCIWILKQSQLLAGMRVK